MKEVALDGTAAADDVLDLSRGVGGSRLKITVSLTGGRISGRLLDKDGDPAQGPMMVFLATDPKQRSFVRVSDGRYSFKAIRPGKYRLFAVDLLEAMPAIDGTGNSGETMQQLFDAGEEIEIKAGDTVSKDIPAWIKMPEKKEAHAPHF